MAKKRAIIGFKGVALAPVTKNDILGYASDVAEALPFAGSLNITPKETTQDIFADDDLYAQVKDVTGEDIELRLIELTLEDAEKLGLGKLNATTNTLEYDYNPEGLTFALRCVCNTVDNAPFYFKRRVFDITGVRFDNFATKGSSITVCEAIITGVTKRPKYAGINMGAIIGLLDDETNQTAMDEFLSAAETFPNP